VPPVKKSDGKGISMEEREVLAYFVGKERPISRIVAAVPNATVVLLD
jgi:hypothetical protein